MLLSKYCERVILEYYSTRLELDFQEITRLENYSSSYLWYRVILDSTRTRKFATRCNTNWQYSKKSIFFSGEKRSSITCKKWDHYPFCWPPQGFSWMIDGSCNLRQKCKTCLFTHAYTAALHFSAVVVSKELFRVNESLL